MAADDAVRLVALLAGGDDNTAPADGSTAAAAAAAAAALSCIKAGVGGLSETRGNTMWLKQRYSENREEKRHIIINICL